MKYFLKKILGHEIFRSMVYEIFFEKFVKPSGVPSYILDVSSLIKILNLKFFII